MDDRTIADTVNTVRDIALNYHHTEQLRARLAHVLVPHLKCIAELERVQGVLVGALDKIDRMTEEAGCNIGGPLAHTNALANHAVAQELLLDADNYLRCISKVSGAALAAAQKPAQGEYFGIPLDDGLVPADTAEKQPTGTCCAEGCDWSGPLSDCVMCGAVGPLCPECHEVVEPDAAQKPEGGE